MRVTGSAASNWRGAPGSSIPTIRAGTGMLTSTTRTGGATTVRLDAALKVNLPGQWFSHAATAAACGQLGEREAAGRAVRDLLNLRPDFAATVTTVVEKWWEPEYVESLIDGWRKAGLQIAGDAKTRASDLGPMRSATTASGAARADEGFWIAVLPFKNSGGEAGIAAFAQGMTDEIVTGLSRFSYLRVLFPGLDVARGGRWAGLEDGGGGNSVRATSSTATCARPARCFASRSS